MKVIRPGSPNKLRDIDISIAISNRQPYSELIAKYGICRQRLHDIYIIILSRLFVQKGMFFNDALSQARKMPRNESLPMLEDYKKFLIDYLFKIEVAE